MIDESRDAPQLEAALLFEYEMMRIETYSRQPDLMFHANDFRVGDCFQLGLDGCRPAQEKLNHLSGESSPYLKRAISQPVDWYPWGAAAFGRAKRAESSHPSGCGSGVVSVVQPHGSGYVHQCRHCGLH